MNNRHRAALAQMLNAPADTRATLHLSPSLESLRGELFDIAGYDFDVVSMEASQQMQQVVDDLVEDALAAREEVTPVPTIPSIYVISGNGLVDGSIADQSMLRQAMTRKLDQDSQVVVALIDEETAEPEDDQPVADRHQIIDAARQFVAEADIPLVDSMEALHHHLDRMLSVSTEHLSTENELTLSVEKISWLRRVFQSDTVKRGNIELRKLAEAMDAAKIPRTPWSEDEIKDLERAVGFTIHRSFHLFLMHVGSFYTRNLRVYNPGDMMRYHMSMRRTNVEPPYRCLVIDQITEAVDKDRYRTVAVLFVRPDGTLGYHKAGERKYKIFDDTLPQLTADCLDLKV